MQFSYIPIAAVLGMAALSTGAQAQVQVYGAIDSYLEAYDNGPKTTMRVSSGGYTGSFFGLRGSEDLGGGLKVLFRLESAFLVDDGTVGDGAGYLFNRMAFVGLAGSFGQVTLGRQTTPYFLTLAANDPAGFTLASSMTYFFVPTKLNGGKKGPPDDRLARRDNAVRYETPRMAGLQAIAYVALGEQQGSNSEGNVYNLALHYQRGALDGRASYLQQKTFALPGNTDRYWAATLSYDFGVFAPALSFADRSGSAPGTSQMQAWQIGASMPLAGGKLIANFGQFHDQKKADADATAWGLRYDYPLSKRTTLYGGYTGIDNEAAANFSIAAGGYMSKGLEGPLGADPRSAFVGVAHRF